MVVNVQAGGVTISRGAFSSDNLRTANPDQWQEIIDEYRLFCTRALPTDCRNLLRMVDEGEAIGWACFDDREHYIREGLGLDPEAVEWALLGLRVMGVAAPVAYDHAQTAGRAQAMAGDDRVSPLPVAMTHAEAGAIGGRGKKANVDNNSFTPGSTNVGYLVRRLKRDAPAIAARLAGGEFRSARAAAIEAGIVKPESLLTTVRRAWKRMTPSDRETFLREIAS
jgi:hypothetical protein